MARAVATSIAAMEFDVHLSATGGGAFDGEASPPGRPPYVVEVDPAHWGDLADVLSEIIEEQLEFDRRLEIHRGGRDGTRIIIVITLTGLAEILVMLGMLEL